jgi:outer membrane protein insertion porin family
MRGSSLFVLSADPYPAGLDRRFGGWTLRIFSGIFLMASFVMSSPGAARPPTGAALPYQQTAGFDEIALRGQTIVAIEYDPVQQPIDTRDLVRMQMVEVSRPFVPLELSATIDRLFASGMYEDIQVDAEKRGAGIALRFITTPRRFIGHVGAQGDIKDPPNRSVIISNAQLQLGTRFDEEALEAARKNIEQELRQNGLFRGQVGVATIEDPDTHQMTIRFLVEAGKRARYETPVITGDTKLPDNTIIAATGWRIRLIHRWRLITQSLTDKGVAGIRKKYAGKDRLTASIELTSLDFDPATNRARPNLDIDAGPRITIKALEAKVSKRNLRKYVPVYEEGAADNDLLTEGARNLHDFFQARGYPDVDVTFKREPPQNDQQIINYYIATGARSKLVKVAITGNDYFPEEILRERMFLQPKALTLRYGRYSENFRKRDEEAITSLYVANGFRDAKVSSVVEADYKGKPHDLAVSFHIREGRQWRVAHLRVEGTAQLNLAPIRDQFSSIEGQPFSEVNIATDRNRILSYYNANGFQSSSFSYQVLPGTDPETVDLIYRVREGPRQFVRKVILSGLYRTRPSLIQKTINLREGEPISLSKIGDISRELTNLGVFAGVNTGLQDPAGSTRYKNVLFDFDEAARYTFNVGFGLEVGQFGATTNSLSQAGGAKGVSPIVSFDVNRLNFLGKGQTLSLQTRYSSLEQRESLNYIVPRFLGSLKRTVTFSVLYDTTQDVQTFSSRRAEASVQTSQQINRASTLLLRFAYRRVSASNINIPSLLVPQLLQPVRIGILSASYIQDHRDNPADAHRGFWNTVDAGLAGKFFGSQRSFVRVLARNATYTSIGRNLVFARQTQIGAIIPFNVAAGTTSFDAIPLPERFFGGGGVSNRGFGDNQAGPRDIGTPNEVPSSVPSPTATGFPIGGNGLFFNTFELRFPLFGPNISGVLFHDSGNIYSTFSDISFAYRQRSDQNFNYAIQAPGFGIRYKTPLGPVRVDLAYALNPSHYNGFSTNITIQDLIACGSNPTANPNCKSGPQRLGHFQFFFSIGQAF